jgi:hypothetical protein
MKLKLISDFRDYYDYVFYPDGDTPVYRMAYDRAMPKHRQFEIMGRAGIPVPPFYEVGSAQANNLYSPDDIVVVYEDEYQHCGGGKLRLSYKEAVNRFAALSHHLTNYYCVPWVNTTGILDESVSYRYLQIGSKAFWLRYVGKGGWMSNHAEDTLIFVEGECDLIESHVLASYPLCAIDFVVSVAKPIPETFEDVINFGVAIDFNTAPGLKWTGIDDILPATEVYRLILAKADRTA